MVYFYKFKWCKRTTIGDTFYIDQVKIPMKSQTHKLRGNHNVDFISFRLPINFEHYPKAVLNIFDTHNNCVLSVMCEMNGEGEIELFDWNILKDVVTIEKYSNSNNVVTFQISWV